MKRFAQKCVERSYKRRVLAILIAAGVMLAAMAVLIPITLHRQMAEFRRIEEAREKQEQSETVVDGGEERQNRERDEWKKEIRSVLHQLPPVGDGAKIVFAVMAALLILLGIFFWITVVEWLYKMAVLHGLNRALWPMLGMIFHILVIPVLLVVLCDPKRMAKRVS